MKSILVFLLMTIALWAEPKVECEIVPDPIRGTARIIKITGNNEVKTLQLITPINPVFYRMVKNKYYFYWSESLPVWPSLYFIVNGKEIHYVPELSPADPVRRPDNSNEANWV